MTDNTVSKDVLIWKIRIQRNEQFYKLIFNLYNYAFLWFMLYNCIAIHGVKNIQKMKDSVVSALWTT